MKTYKTGRTQSIFTKSEKYIQVNQYIFLGFEKYITSKSIYFSRLWKIYYSYTDLFLTSAAAKTISTFDKFRQDFRNNQILWKFLIKVRQQQQEQEQQQQQQQQSHS